MEPFDRTPATPYGGTREATPERVTTFLRTVYGWMCAGSPSPPSSPTPSRARRAGPGPRYEPPALPGPVRVQIGLVFYLSARVDRIAPGTATLLFIAYAALTGVTLSVLVLAYTGASIATTFVVTAGMFGALALTGPPRAKPRRSGPVLLHGVDRPHPGVDRRDVLDSQALQFLISVVGVIVFTGLTAWDAQRLKQMAAPLPEAQVGSYAIVGALSLYLDFINLFLFMLRFLGGRRE